MSDGQEREDSLVDGKKGTMVPQKGSPLCSARLMQKGPRTGLGGLESKLTNEHGEAFRPGRTASALHAAMQAPLERAP